MAEHSLAKSRKDRIMEAALRIFAVKGFQNATISEISKEAGVSEATVYEYFGTKEDLLFAIPEKISNETNEALEKVLPYIRGVEGRMRAILRGYVHLYESNPFYSALVLLQLLPNKKFRQTAAHSAIRKSARLLLTCIKEGIEDGTFRKDFDPYLIRSILLGGIEHLFIRWHMQGTPQKPAMGELLDPFLQIILDGIRVKKEEPVLTLRLKMEDPQALRDLLSVRQVKEGRKTEMPEGPTREAQAGKSRTKGKKKGAAA
jgi:TetR/AcrR family transcriptional regulator, fatty acid metabolism regulator protein